MTQPGNDSGFGPLFDRDALGPGDGPGANGSGMIGNGTGQSLCKIGVTFMKIEKCYNGPKEIFDVLGLGLLSDASADHRAPGVALCCSFGFQFGTN